MDFTSATKFPVSIVLTPKNESVMTIDSETQLVSPGETVMMQLVP